MDMFIFSFPCPGIYFLTSFFHFFNLGTSSAFRAIQRHRFVHGHVHIPVPVPWGHRFSLIPFMKMAVILRRIFAQFGGSWRASWDHFALMLGHLSVLEAKISLRGRFSKFDPRHFGDVCIKSRYTKTFSLREIVLSFKCFLCDVSINLFGWNVSTTEVRAY